MEIKYKIKLFLLIVLPLFILNSCLEEPTIPPVQRPYSVVRVGNFSMNLQSFSVFIDDAQPVGTLSSLAKGAITDYFDVSSGKRTFKIVDANSNTVFEKQIDIASFERVTVIFAGYYSTDELQNTFGNFEFSGGEVYIDYSPAQDSISLFFVHASPDSPTDTTKKLSITARYKPIGSSEFIDTSLTLSTGLLEYSEIDSDSLGNYFAPGDIVLEAISEEGDILASDSSTYNPNMLYYIFLYDEPDNIKILRNEIAPPPVRSKN
jgi:hypothetical protein